MPRTSCTTCRAPASRCWCATTSTASGSALSKEALAQRPRDLWRYRELLPVRRTENIVSLGEAVTPLVALRKLAGKLGAAEILVKDEGRLPTGSFKARGLAMAVSMAKALGVAHMAMPTNGNAGAALAAYASRAGIRTTVVLSAGHARGQCQRDRACRARPSTASTG